MQRLAWAGVAIGGVLLSGAACTDRSSPAGAGLAKRDGADAASDAGVACGDAGGGGGVGGGAGGGGGAICPADFPPDPSDTGSPPPFFARQPGTQAPFGCNPLPGAFFFAPPGPEVPGVYSRYASYEVGAASSAAASPDGRLAALATADGVVRVVELATDRVVGVLARPRAWLDLVAFSPSGDALLTVARGEREATLWRTATLAPAWTVQLPGHTQDNASLEDFGFTVGGAAFSPDGASAVVSPGRGVFRLDVATGAILAGQLSPSLPVVAELAYGWGGRRVVITEPSLAAHCIHSPHGGTVVLRDPDTLAVIRVLADWGSFPMVIGQPAFRASPTDDYVLAAGTDDAPAPRAFRLSDGQQLPAPPLATLPRAFFPDGARVLAVEGGAPPAGGGAAPRVEVRVHRLADGKALAGTTVPAIPETLAIAGDGSVVLLAARGANLLRAWMPGADRTRAACTADARVPSTILSSPVTPPASLSADGTLLALGWGNQPRMLRVADGQLVRAFAAGGEDTSAVQLAPDGRFLLVRPAAFPEVAPVAFRVADGARVAELMPASAFWADTVFSPDDRKLYAVAIAAGAATLSIFNLETGGPPQPRLTTDFPGLLGFSSGCLVIDDQVLGIFRSCNACDDPPFAAGSRDGRLAPGGRFVVTSDPETGGDSPPGVTVYRMRPGPAPVRHFPPRAEEATFDAREIPIAVSRDDRVVLLGAGPRNPSCYAGPRFEVRVRDVGTGALVDSLPPRISTVDATAATLAGGAQIWRRRD